jgi:hypothetical protein
MRLEAKLAALLTHMVCCVFHVRAGPVIADASTEGAEKAFFAYVAKCHGFKLVWLT